MMLVDKLEIGFIIKGVEIGKALSFNKKVFATVYFYFISDYFSLF